MDTRREEISERPLSGLLSGQACTLAESNPVSHPKSSLGAQHQKKPALSQAQESDSDLPVGLPKKINHRWKLSEINFLRENFDRLSNQELADQLGLPKNKVRAYADHLGLKRTKWIQSKRGGKQASWEAFEIFYLQENYHRFEASFIGRKINRTAQAVWQMAKNLNLKKSKTNGKI